MWGLIIYRLQMYTVSIKILRIYLFDIKMMGGVRYFRYFIYVLTL